MPFEVLPYTFDNLKRVFLKKALASDEIILEKSHVAYFHKYLSAINSTTIVFEDEYIDRDFLVDYSSYYVRSFKDYNRKCSRAHFFKNSFAHDEFKKLLRGEPCALTHEQLRENYQGFIVLKPLPATIFGRTCLTTYENKGNRYFPCTRKYDVNLFGVSLTIKSVAYQEQDSIVAACASSALWSAFQSTAILFQHSLPSPSEITKSVLVHFPFSNRNFPNKSLTGEQMALSIREIGLDPYLFSSNSYDTVKATIYAYLKGKIPVILGLSLWDSKNNNPDEPVMLGGHAVTVLGYNLGGTLSNSFDGIPELSLVSSKIDKIYVHDDQIGPFAKMEFKDFELNFTPKLKVIDTTYKNSSGEEDKVKALPQIIILPLYHKIRITFENILKVINSVKEVQILVNKAPGITSYPILEWDIFLSDLSDFKSDILNNPLVDSGDYKELIVTGNFPKYLWRAIGMSGSDKKIELLFDATDIDQGIYYLQFISYDNTTVKYFKLISSLFDLKAVYDMNLKAILSSFR